MRIAALLTLILLAGCAVTPKIFDPAPFDPTANQNVAPSTTLAARPTMPPLLTFDSYADASAKLYVLQSAYRQESDTISRETPLFDIPLIGLAIATVANPDFPRRDGGNLGARPRLRCGRRRAAVFQPADKDASLQRRRFVILLRHPGVK